MRVAILGTGRASQTECVNSAADTRPAFRLPDDIEIAEKSLRKKGFNTDDVEAASDSFDTVNAERERGSAAQEWNRRLQKVRFDSRTLPRSQRCLDMIVDIWIYSPGTCVGPTRIGVCAH